MPRRTIQLFPLLVVTTSGFCISKICPLRLPVHQVLKESNGYQPSNGESSEEMYWEKYSGTRIEEDEAYTKEDISWENGGQIQKYDDDDYYCSIIFSTITLPVYRILLQQKNWCPRL